MFRLYRASIAQVLPISAGAALLGLPVSLYQLRLNAQVEAGDVDQAAAAAVMMLTDPVYWLVVFLSGMLQLWLFTAVTLQISGIGVDQPLSTKEALSRAVRPVAPLFVMYLVYLVTVAATFILVIGIVLMVSWVLGYILVLEESKGPIAALRASHRLVWGNWWRTAATLTVGAIILTVLYLALGLGLGVGIAVVDSDSQVLEIVVSTATAFIITLLVTPLYPALFLAIYWDLKMRKQGSDLEARVGALGASA